MSISAKLSTHTIEELELFYNKFKDKVLEEIHEEFNGKVVRIIGEIKRHLLFGRPRPSLQPVYQENVINLEFNKLTSSNYNEYEDEYLKLCLALNIFPRLNSVRAFILLWAEKQRRYYIY